MPGQIAAAPFLAEFVKVTVFLDIFDLGNDIVFARTVYADQQRVFFGLAEDLADRDLAVQVAKALEHDHTLVDPQIMQRLAHLRIGYCRSVQIADDGAESVASGQGPSGKMHGISPFFASGDSRFCNGLRYLFTAHQAARPLTRQFAAAHNWFAVNDCGNIAIGLLVKPASTCW